MASIENRLRKLEARRRPQEQAATVLVTIGDEPLNMSKAEAEDLLQRQPDNLTHIVVDYVEHGPTA